MALSRRGSGGQRLSATIWPGFVDAMTALLMVLMFVLTIFMLVQSVLRERISSQDSELEQLGAQLAGLTDALSDEQDRAGGLEADLARMAAAAEAQEAALSAARDEVDAQAEAARLAAARREALEALLADLREKGAADAAALAEAGEQLSEAEAARLADAAAAQALRERLAGAETELTAMTLSLEEARREAAETLTLLAAAEAARDEAQATDAAHLEDADAQAALLAAAEARIAAQDAMSADEARKLALLNAQLADLRGKLASVESALEISEDSAASARLEAEGLGARLNAALLAKAEAEQARARLQEEARVKAEAEARDLARYKSEFFGRLSEILAGRDGVKVVGDRFIFDSNVLFAPGAAALSEAGRAQIAGVTQMLREISGTIPSDIDWVIRVDGHTDDQPLSGNGLFHDNWELSQARALAVVRYMTGDLGFPADRLAATGFGEFRPAVPGSSPEARAANRRIELKLTER